MNSKPYVIFSRHFDPQSANTYSRIIQILGNNNVELAIWGTLYDQMLAAGFADANRVSRLDDSTDISHAAAVLSVGGDGTFLAAAKMVMHSAVPVLGINCGRLGFLSDVPPDALTDALADVLSGNYRLVDVPVLNMYVGSQREPLGYAINEFAVSKCDGSSMLTVDAYVDGDFLTSYWADGLIIATATGSTAYSLSVGGPIVSPSTPSLVLSPVAPHNLTIRPLVLPDNVAITLHVDGRGDCFMVAFDGQTQLLKTGSWLRIAKSKLAVKRIQLSSYSFFATIREKLMWGADMRNKQITLHSLPPDD